MAAIGMFRRCPVGINLRQALCGSGGPTTRAADVGFWDSAPISFGMHLRMLLGDMQRYGGDQGRRSIEIFAANTHLVAHRQRVRNLNCDLIKNRYVECRDEELRRTYRGTVRAQ